MVSEPSVSEIEIPADSRFIATARNFVSGIATGAGWVDGAQLDDLRLIVSETVTNALAAQADHSIDDLVRLRTVLHDDRIEILVSDAAGGFDLADADLDIPEPDLLNEGGFGLPLIDALSDEAQFTRTGRGTTVRLVVYRDRPGQGSGDAAAP